VVSIGRVAVAPAALITARLRKANKSKDLSFTGLPDSDLAFL